MEYYKYGEIVLINFNPTIGDEIKKIRPAVVISRNSINKIGRFLLVIPITSNVSQNLSLHIKVKKSELNNLESHSKIVTDQLRSVDKIRVRKIIGSLETEYLKLLEKRLLFLINQEEKF